MRQFRYIVCWILVHLVSLPMAAQMNTDRLLSIGRNALYFEDYVLSIQYFNRVIRHKPYLSDPYLYRAIAKLQLGDNEGALEDCHLCIQYAPFHPGAYYTRGFAYYQLEDYAAAEQDFTKALELSPDNKGYLQLRAQTRGLLHHYDEALEDMEQLLRRCPSDGALHVAKGSILMEKGDSLLALNAYQEGTRLAPGNPSSWSALGLMQSMMHQDGEAVESLSQAIDLGSKWVGDYINRGIVYYRLHNYRGALSDYDEAVRLAPDNASVYYNRGLLRQEVGDFNRALEDYDRVFDLDASMDEALFQRGVVQLELRQWAEAQADFDTLIARHPYFLPSYYLAAQARTGLKDARGAYNYRWRAQQKEKELDRMMEQDKLQTDVQYAVSHPQRDRAKQILEQTAQSDDKAEDDDVNLGSESRGAVQHRYANIASEPIIVLSYYAQAHTIRSTPYYHFAVDSLSRVGYFTAPLNFTLKDMPITAELAAFHFSQIDLYSDSLSLPSAPALQARWYFARAMEYALLQDYRSAIEDCTSALMLYGKQEAKAEQAVIYFCRANWRNRLMEYQRLAGEEVEPDKARLDYELLLRDYDQVILLCPDFVFAYYNKANVLCSQADFAAAIDYYSMAILRENRFAEAWFNRGLARILLNQTESGMVDLSKSGELGIYQAYNIISRLK